MAGLLDFLQTPEAQLGIGLLAYSGDMGRPMGFGERIAGAIGATQRQQQMAEEKKLRAGLLEAQLGELQSKAAQRDHIRSISDSIFGAPTTNMGGGSNVAPDAGTQPSVQQLRGVPIERIAALKQAGGADLTELWKLANVPTPLAAGSYAFIPGQTPQYMADPSKGLGIGPQGVYALHGAAEAQAALAGAQEAAVQRARAGFDLVNIKGPQGETLAVPRSQVLGSAAPSGAPAGFATEGQMRAGMAQPMSGNAGQYGRDIADIQKALATPGLDASSRQLLQQELANRTEQRSRYFGNAPAAPAMAGNVVELSADQQATNKASEAFKTKTAETDSQQLATWRAAAEAGNNMLNTAQNLKAAIQQGVYSGGGAQAKTAIASMIGGITGVQLKNLPGSELFNAEASKLVLDSIKALGANPSNADREFIERTIPALERSPEARDALIGFLERKGNAAVNLYQRADAYARKNNGLGGFNQFDKPQAQRKVVKTGMYGGRKVVQYDDGTVDYAN